MLDNTGASVIVGLAVGIAFILLFATFSPSLSVLYNDRPVTITGEVACLPHKNIISDSFVSVETAECAIGFHSREGKYYGFDNLFLDKKYNWLFYTHGSNELFNVTGIVRQASDDLDRYDVSSMIDITSAGRADGIVSVYEVYARHYSELSNIIELIGKRTAGEYSIGVDAGCDDLNPKGDSFGKSCILIALNKDLPELSDKIPRSIEGFGVRVHVFA
jgi:hypothetical protein